MNPPIVHELAGRIADRVREQVEATVREGLGEFFTELLGVMGERVTTAPANEPPRPRRTSHHSKPERKSNRTKNTAKTETPDPDDADDEVAVMTKPNLLVKTLEAGPKTSTELSQILSVKTKNNLQQLVHAARKLVGRRKIVCEIGRGDTPNTYALRGEA